ncbi:MAG: S8 family serine peptidase [Candidatus Marinimicrobia bacterium]|nr:S8 family serine peptidase [Candidatus Neomarinimicrobiota bacterium]
MKKIFIYTVLFSQTLLLYAITPPNDPMFLNQWNLSKINILEAWNVTTGNPTIKIAVIDNGVDIAHEDLFDNLVIGYNAVNPGEDPDHSCVPCYHGTAVAGIAGATTNNALGIAGVAYNCKIMPVKWIQGLYSQLIPDDNSIPVDAINWAVSNGADVINISWEFNNVPEITNAINSAVSNGRSGKGCIVVCAAGNDGDIIYPATLSSVICVGMTNSSDDRISGSGTGTELDIMAPGKVPTLDPMTPYLSYGNTNTGYDNETNAGTSYASPHVAGVAALMLSANSELTHTQVKEILYRTAKDLGDGGWDSHYGWGRVDAGKAVKTAARLFTTSGQLIEDEFWWGSVTLTNNVTVPAGIKLTILSDALVNFNGHNLTSSGGTISLLKGGIITLNSATYVDFPVSGSTTYEVNGINVGTTFNGIGQSIKANPPSGYGYGWSDGVGGNYRYIYDDVTVNAKLKALHKSTTMTAWDNTSQRKLIQTSAGGNPRWLHQVYTSAGHVWIEHSGDGGSTWTLGNNGQPLDGTAGGKCPSITYANQGWLYYDNYIGVVWQEKDGTHYKIKGKIFNQYGDVNLPPSPYYEVTTLFTEPNDTYDGDNANPNLVMYVGYASPYFLTFERKSTHGSLQPGINWLGGYTEDSGQRFLGPFGLPDDQGLITGTNSSTTNVQLSIVSSDLDFCINLVQQAGPTGGVYGHFIYLYPEEGGDWYYYQENHGRISYPSANKSPSIVSLMNYLYNACWIEVEKMVFYYRGTPSVLRYYGYSATSCSINRGGGGSNSGFAVWSQQPSSGTKSNKSIRFSGGSPVSGTTQTLSTSGKYVQVGNGPTSDHSYMQVSSFYPNTLPYYFSTSQTLGPLSKSSSELVEGRGFIINKGDASFKYCFNDLNVDGINIAFVDVSDTLDYDNIDVLNNALITEPFQLNTNSKVIFMEQSGFTDSAVASKALEKDDYIHYKIELIDDATGKVIGAIKNVNLTSLNVHSFKTPTYSLNTKGLTSKTARVKITLETNIINENSERSALNDQDLSRIPATIREKLLNIKNPDLILIKSFSEENISLAKAVFELLEMEESDVPISYSLAQNYPNPFNPITTIRYELPKAGNVTLKVYNLLGKEVATLVKGEQKEGRYSVIFDGSRLASGEYIVRMQSGNFSKTIKILLMK